MTKRKNEFGIKSLVMCPVLNIVDPTTQAGLQLKATVEFFPDEFLPEFVDAQSGIRQKIEKQKMTVDAAADALIDFFNEYEPKGLKVKVDVINNNTFFPVTVTVTSGVIDDAETDKKKPAKKSLKKESITAGKDDEDEDEDEE